MTNFDYKKCFNSYNDLLEQLNENFHFIDKKLAEKLSLSQISNLEKATILAFISRRKNLGSAGVGDFEDVLDILYTDKTELIKDLEDLLTTTKDPILKVKLKKLLNIVYDKAVSEAHIKLAPSAFSKMKKSWKYPYNGSVNPFAFILNKVYEKREFIFKKSINEKYLPTVAVPTNNKYQFNSLSFEELQSWFIPSKFYELSADAVEELSQALVNKYCESMGVESCKVNFDILTSKSTSLTYGQYMINEGSIKINKRFATGFEDAKFDNNPVFPLKLASTLIHEAQHRVQFASLDRQSKSEREELVKQSILHPNCKDYFENGYNETISLFKNYLSEPDEVDARNAALTFIHSMLANNGLNNEFDTNRIAAFYNDALRRENANNKYEYKAIYKSLFPHIYNQNYINITNASSVAKEIEFSNEQTFSILKSTNISPWLKSFEEPTLI